ncbi:AAA family ATPase, CDC48 subfamily [Halalkaliarchaeum desulfuricum]|uniref:AAA family ATPase, CDC48 subfamily n=1 Tax=Halalkaliarchaeum desulfuricum TaxID=2055893 RepID=A0A343TN10_9EURY|nr:AAA family ATPase [Halalkaliarchaeum desulfuricum]AUX10482.1 AAA family ATPase, CDC48 subfamily [Halalkaliarchaeum desulfuricum]
MSEEFLELTVRGAQKRDAGRGIARLPESARRALGVLSGDTVVVEGEQTAVAKVWPGGANVDDGEVRIDADTRANAGAKIGETVRLSTVSVTNAKRVVLDAPAELASVDVTREAIERALARELRDRPLRTGEQVHVERLGGIRFLVSETVPSGTVRVADSTDVELEYRQPDAEASKQGSRSERSSEAGVADRTGEGDDTGGRITPTPPPTTGVTYEDIGGLDEELDLVREMIELPLSEPEVFARLGVEPPKGVLLHGPPGTGKTLIARAVANEVDATFITIDGPEIMSKYKGESEERLREVFQEAEAEAPAIVFFDELDSIAGKRDDGGDVENRVVGQLLSLMDGLDARGDVIVIGATNRVDTLDPALRRGGRFDREIQIGVPGEAGRREILDVHTRRMPLADDVDVDRLAARTHGFVGADLESLVKEAAMTALRRARDASRSLTDVKVEKRDFEAAMAAVEPSAMREHVAETPSTGFDDVGGLEDAKRKLERAVTWPLTYAPLFEAANTTPPTGILLYGPPGTGKTLLARAIAGESEVNFIRVDGPELLDRYVGESEKAVREVFERARQAAPSILFFDEIDAVAGDRDALGSDSGVGERVVSQLLTELDRTADNPNLVVLAATNRRDVLDEALLRPGRLETHVEVPNPDRDARHAILEVHTRGKPLAEDVDLGEIAEETDGYSGADLTAVCREAALLAIQKIADSYEGTEANEHAEELLLTADHFQVALEAVGPFDAE